jgi:ATP-dependent Clp protease ATP-binding subunit ClpA
VVDKFIDEVKTRLQEKNIRLMASKSAREYLARHGFDSHYGARPLSRLIQEQISNPLANAILFGELKQGGSVKIGCRNDTLTFNFAAAAKQGQE